MIKLGALCAGMALWLAPAGANASSARVVANADGTKSVIYTATAGESNNLEIHKRPPDWSDVTLRDKYLITDNPDTGSGARSGADITPGVGCVRGKNPFTGLDDPHIAVCAPSGTVKLKITLADQANRAYIYPDTAIGVNPAVAATITGGTRTDQIWDAALGVSDTITTSGGPDFVDSGPGTDTIHGGSGNEGDRLDDGSILYGGLTGGDGNDQVYGGPGADLVVRGGGNDDLVDGGPGADRVYGDDLWQNAGTDILHGGDANDTLYGGPGPDTYYGDGGNDTLDAQDGNTPEASSDVINGGAGIDTATYRNWVNADRVTITLDQVANDGLPADGANRDNVGPLGDVENITGRFGSHGDTLTGNGQPNLITAESSDSCCATGAYVSGLGGNDTLIGTKSGDDLIIGGLGNDVITADGGVDIVKARDGLADTVDCGNGSPDTAYLDPADTHLNGTCENLP